MWFFRCNNGIVVWIFCGTGVWTQGLQSRHTTDRAMLPVHFALVILEIGSHKLFLWAGLKLWSFWSHTPGSWDYRCEPPLLAFTPERSDSLETLKHLLMLQCNVLDLHRYVRKCCEWVSIPWSDGGQAGDECLGSCYPPLYLVYVKLFQFFNNKL
jgi:hypothetical protein